ncbi:MAG: hypothetical protein KC618_03535 [Candidatus Omnitrophica bacterium]|nr:hypothetical protein [Candidatus Omnitrophota bacterium]
MTFWNNKNAGECLKAANYLWWLPALFPLLAILSSYMHGTWSWGLMDDVNMVGRPGTIWERFCVLFSDLLGAGRFNPTFSFHCAFFYRIFENHPKAFFVFRWVEVVMALILWGFLAYKVTQKKIAIPLFFAIALSFLKFYDAFFFLSTQEILGVFFSGSALVFFLYALKPAFTHSGKLRKTFFIPGVLCLLLAFGSKEPFVSVGIALGFSLIVSWIKNRQRKDFLTVGIVMFSFSVGYALFLKTFVAKGYSAGYSLTWNEISGNIQQWFHDVLIGSHGFWIIITIFILSGSVFSQDKKQERAVFYFWIMIFGLSVYVLYLLLILPWNAWGHYVTPLGIFFAFTLTVFLAGLLDSARTWLVGLAAVISLGVNLYAGGKALHFHAQYQQDTQQMLVWLSQNALFQHEVMEAGAVVRCNANEPSGAIQKLVNKYHGQNYPKFIFTPKVGDILNDPATRYYIWAPSWGDQDLRRLGNMWTPMFVSESWIVFRRMR